MTRGVSAQGRANEAPVRREKGAYIQWEEDIPPGNLRSSRKQSRQFGREINQLKPLMQKDSCKANQRACRPQ